MNTPYKPKRVVLRGGAWDLASRSLCSAYHKCNYSDSDYYANITGFRIMLRKVL